MGVLSCVNVGFCTILRKVSILEIQLVLQYISKNIFNIRFAWECKT